MKNGFESVFLDNEKRTLLTKYLLKRGYIDKYINGEKINYNTNKPLFSTYKLQGIKNLFIVMTLYENIDFTVINYDYCRFYDMGMSEKNGRKIGRYGMLEIAYALKLMSISHKKLLVQCHKYYCNTVNTKNFTRLLMDIFIPTGMKYLYENVDFIFLKSLEMANKEEIPTNESVNILSYIKHTMYSLVEGLSSSTNLYTDIFKGTIDYTPKIVESMYYVCKMELPKNINILPAPQTLSDVISFRKSPYIKSFRNVFGEWMQYIEEGNFNLAKKIEKDVIKANSYFEKLGKYHKFASNPFVRTCIFAGGFIPGISEIINISTYVGGLIEDRLTEKNNWVLISNGK